MVHSEYMADVTTMPPTFSAPRTARQRVRAELTNEIKDVARQHLRDEGSAGLSLRAIARDLGMVSSAVYRYFPSRDDLLTALIVDAYLDLGVAVQHAEAPVRRSDHVGRFMAACRATRAWALGKPQEYALIFGSPIPGYKAPQDTVDPAAMVPLVLVGILIDAVPTLRADGQAGVPMSRDVRADMKLLRETSSATAIDERTMALGVMAWTLLIGSISFELFGHLHNVVFHNDEFFDHQMRTVANQIGL